MEMVGRLRNNLVFIGTALVVMVLPYSITGTSISIIILLLAWIIEGGWQNKIARLKSNYLFFAFISLFVIQVIGLFYSENLVKGHSEIEKKLSLLIFPLIFASSENITHKRVVLILKAFVFSCIIAISICTFYAILQTLNYDKGSRSVNWDLITIDEFNKNNVGYSHRWDAFSYMEFTSILEIHPTYLSLFVLFSILILIYLQTSFPIKKSLRIIYNLIITLFFVSLILLAARIILVITVCLALLSIIFYLIKKKQTGRIFIYSFIFIGLLTLLVYNIPFTKYRLIDQLNIANFQFPDHHDKWNSTNLRIAQWYCSFQTFIDHPLIGVGTGDSQDYLQECYKTLDLGPFYKVYNAHNQYLQIAVSSGIIGLIIFIGCLLLPLRKAISPIYLGFLLVFTMCCLTESLLQSQKGIVFYALFNSLMAFQLAKSVKTNGKESLINDKSLKGQSLPSEISS